MSGPLAGVRVIDVTGTVAGPFATQVLGDAGADVIKIESPEGDPTRDIGPRRHPGMAAYFLNLNRNKRSVVLDLKRPAGKAAMLRLVGGADVFVHNMRLPAAERLGLDAASLRTANPRLVYAALSGFRADGPRRGWPAYDDLVQGMSGLASLNGAGGPPRYVPTVIADKIAGQVLAGAIAMALYARERTGAPQDVHVPMLETMLAFTLIEHLWGATFGGSDVGYPRLQTPHRRPYATRDGYICVIPVTDEQWRRLLSAVGRPEVMDDPRFASIGARSDNIDAVYGFLTDILATRGTAEWRALLDAADIPNGPASTLQDVMNDDYLRAIGFFRHFNHPTEGAVTTLAPAVDFQPAPLAIRRGAPELGADTEAVLREAGLSADQIDAARGTAL
jgi:crotonobetainyl-CoA:carnitine CoA-transferase CaiB-like acyl-CoA transferase